LHRAETSASELVNRVIAETESQAQAASATLSAKFADPALAISADEEKLNQVLLNLVLNAIQSVNGNGKIEIATDYQMENDRSFAVFSIRDNGAGIPSENLARVFEPFYTTRKHGTGLGLPNAKKIVEAHGGTITIQSATGKGTEVTIKLPQGDTYA
jgi:signal transduction histidine kinase